MHRIIKEDIENLANNLKSEWPKMEGKSILVTGACGFLGIYITHLIQHLNESCLTKPLKAILMDNNVTGHGRTIDSDNNITFVSHNIIEPYHTMDNIDLILHGAGIASPAYYTKFPLETLDVGTVGTRNLLELAKDKNVESMIFMSSSEVYGDPDSAHVPTDENYLGNVDILGARACYDESKRLGETLCSIYYSHYQVPVKIIRPFNVYGPGIRPDDYRVLPNFIENAIKQLPLPVHGDGNNTRSFCYINDAIEAVMRVLLCSANGEPFNVGNPQPEISVKTLADRIAQIFPFDVKVQHIDPPHEVYASTDPKRRCPNIKKLQRLTGFSPRYSLQQGLERTIEWFMDSRKINRIGRFHGDTASHQ